MGEEQIKKKKPIGKKSAKSNARLNYNSSSKNFVDWVNGLGIEKTLLGKWLHFLDEKFHLRKLSYFFLYCFVLSLLIHFDYKLVNVSLNEGDVVPADIKAPFNFEFSDYIETATQKQEAEDSIPPIFDYNSETYDDLYQKLDKAFRMMRVELSKTVVPKREADFASFAQQFLKNKNRFEEILQVRSIPENLFVWLTQKRFSSLYLSYVYRILEPVNNLKILSDLRPLERSSNDTILVRTIEIATNTKPIAVDEKKLALKDLVDIKQVRNQVIKRDYRFLRKRNMTDRKALKRFTSNLIIPNLSMNIEETALRRQQVREAVPTVLASVKKGQVILPAGAPAQKKQIMILNEIRKISTQKNKDFISIVTALLLTVVALVLLSFLKRFTVNKTTLENKDIMVMGVVGFFMVFLSKALLLITDVAAIRGLGFSAPDNFFLYLTPVASATMMVGLLFTRGEIVWLFSLFLATALSMMVKFDFNFFIFTAIGSVAAARGVFNSKKRNDVYLAGLRVGAVNFIVVACLTWLTGKDQSFHDIMWLAPAGFFSGVFSSLVTMMLIPLFESVFNYTTDVRLMELSNLNHPLMKEMLLKAPGTYHHCVMVGTMAESAAEEIGANPLLSKVSAFYHDIGKMHHAEYFVENQRPGHNAHDNISPHMSKTILVAHVKDGAELGIQYKLGKPIIDVILQHHGTSLISYFYNKAKELEDDIHKVREEEFRYPGPKPQFKEAGLVMLADSIEAAARSLEEPTASRLQNIVKNIIQNKFLDGQLDECNITLKDLSIIEEVFERILLTIYHQRIDYPTSMGGVDSEKSEKLVKIKGR